MDREIEKEKLDRNQPEENNRESVKIEIEKDIEGKLQLKEMRNGSIKIV